MAWQVNKFKFVRGQAEKFVIILLDANGVPMNIAGASAISFALKKSDGSILTKPAETGLAWGLMQQLYIYAFSMTPEETALLPLGKDQDLAAVVTIGGAHQEMAFWKAVEIVDACIS